MKKEFSPVVMYGTYEPCDERPPFRDVHHALRFFMREAPKTKSVPCLDGVNLTKVAQLDDNGDVTGYEYVPTPRVQGGVGSVIESRLCSCVDVERCLPDSYEDKLIVLARTLYPVRKSIEVMRELVGGSWYNRRFYHRYERAITITERRLRRRHLIPSK